MFPVELRQTTPGPEFEGVGNGCIVSISASDAGLQGALLEASIVRVTEPAAISAAEGV
jgi:hypothetical protein